MKKMLFLTTRPPFPPRGGERLRPYNFIKHLCGQFRIKVLSFYDSQIERRQALDYRLPEVELDMIGLPKPRSYLQCAVGLFGSRPLELSYYHSPFMLEAVRRQLASGGYDLIFCHLLRLAPYAQGARIAKVLDLSDALTLRYGISSRYRKGPFKIVERIESRRLGAYEPSVIKNFDLNIVSSSVDKAYLEGELGAGGLEVVENGADPEDISPEDRIVEAGKIVFFANLRAFHNIDAISFFYDKIYPLVRSQSGNARLVIVGANMPQKLKRLAGKNGVRVYSDVEDIRPYVRDACVCVAPMRIAVGIQNKVIQSMSLGLPVVTTSIGLGGISAQDGENVLVADDPQVFAQKVLMLLEDAALRQRISARAMDLIRERYSWPALAGKLADRINGLLCKR